MLSKTTCFFFNVLFQRNFNFYANVHNTNAHFLKVLSAFRTGGKLDGLSNDRMAPYQYFIFKKKIP